MAPGLDLTVLAQEAEDTTHTNTLLKKSIKIASPTTTKGSIVLDPSHITTEFDLLRFEAAAFAQLRVTKTKPSGSTKDGNGIITSSHLISSPYNNLGHYLDLEDLDKPTLIFSKALTALKPVRPDYATAPYTDALDFATVLDLIRNISKDEGYQWKEQSFYVVVFRSKLKEKIDNELLYALDYESHREACESGGLLKYWFGAPNCERRNLATCFWRSREDARLGGLGPWHKKARAAGRELYDSIIFSTHRFTILDDATGFRFEDWDESPRTASSYSMNSTILDGTSIRK